MTDSTGRRIGQFEPVGNVAASLVEKIRPKEYAEYQLRQAIADALAKIGRANTQEIIEEELAA